MTDFEQANIEHTEHIGETISMLHWTMEGVDRLDWPTPNPTVGIVPTGAVLLMQGMTTGGAQVSLMVTSKELTRADATRMTSKALQALVITGMGGAA